MSHKIDNQATDGLSGVSNSLAYRVGEVERHLHSNESWFGAALVPAGETHIADRIGTAVAGLVLDAGNDTWGAWTQVLGSSDTPARAGNTKFDFHRIFITAVENASTVHFVQFAFGATGAGAYTAGDFTEFVYRSGAALNREAPVDFQTRRYAMGTKVWGRVYAIGRNTSTITFFAGLHEYEG